MKYKVGDIYTEKLTKFIGVDGTSGIVVTAPMERRWKIIDVDYGLNQITCKTDDEYKVFKIN